MATDKDIREFIQQNKIRIPTDDKFMDDLLRQIELLPTPASLQPKEKSGLNKSEQIEILKQITAALKRHNRRTATTLLFGVMVIGAIVCALPYILSSSAIAAYIPVQYNSIITTGLYIIGALAILGVIRGLYRRTEFI